jgi:DNA-binding response OmpR family regulator
VRLLLVEDDTLLGQGLHAGLRRENYSVDWVKNGEAALAALRSAEYAAAILDLGLPDISGIEVLSTARAEGIDLPVLILTAQDALESRIAGLDAGADDYLAKPFELAELCARLRALTRRARGKVEQLLRYRDIELNPAAHTVTKAGEAVELSRREFALLEELLYSVGRVMSRAQLEEKLYSWRDEVGSNAIEVHIHHLRKRLGSELIKTVRGVGYLIPRQ